MTTYTNRYGMAGKILAGVEADSNRPVAYIVPDNHGEITQNLAEYLQRFNGKRVRIVIEHDVPEPAPEFLTQAVTDAWTH